ncbi:uncharacterized protein LACBIDRAFT_314309 [Laccaria bicolor S238N-H82]|uniref:Predicted protein n=1 Tax=Laccaria bicolor (strain S238N-H82 / ATCC MYA-4686) TaxID=486041 RepID=B0DY95_LACBS|nr:uncharacterized protein LACBIDRAFT_314309 [Laccaria bicolor S238N-H82]EDR00395.1 predicted protein [Laccaria bicolor S238N-H82]|eukprot:XP_001888954.1 predicted protein [Laccaria bicolor S238N-H82]
MDSLLLLRLDIDFYHSRRRCLLTKPTSFPYFPKFLYRHCQLHPPTCHVIDVASSHVIFS